MAETVLVTGFGPFRDYKVNASWEVAKALHTLNLEEDLGVKLVTKEILVAYDTVNSLVPKLWEDHKPELVVHLGVSSLASKLTVEKMAHKSGYNQKDVCGQLPKHGSCRLGDDECVFTDVDVSDICKEVNSQNIGVEVCSSENAGRYLCEFTYYTSLCINPSRVVFVHVPELDKKYTAEQMALGVKKIIQVLLTKIRSQEKNEESTTRIKMLA